MSCYFTHPWCIYKGPNDKLYNWRGGLNVATYSLTELCIVSSPHVVLSAAVFSQTELQHFEHKINKHEYFLKEAAMAKANIHLEGKVTQPSEFHQQLEQRVNEYALKVSFDK